MQVFVTGGSGFVGRNIIRALVARGDRVHALARSDAALQAVAALGAQGIRGDLHDLAAMQTGMKGCTVVFHAAAQVTDWGDPQLYHDINVRGTENVLTAARAAGVKRVVHISTEAVLANGMPLHNVDETRPRPDDALPRYPQSKGLAEAAVLKANGGGMHTVVVRPRFIWGRDDTSLLPQILAAVRQGKFMWIDGGRYLSSTCHIDNVVEGCLLAAEKGRPAGIYFLTDGVPVEFREFLTQLLATQGVAPGNKSLPRALAWTLAVISEAIWNLFRVKSPPPITRVVVNLIGQEVTVNDAKARRELGYQSKMSRAAGLADLVARATR
ncbi:MAG: NAD-dependent epimerase/dehydratase family protein [Nevskiales bacterium]